MSKYIKVGSKYVDNCYKLWRCASRSCINGERLALLMDENDVVWYTSEKDWKFLTEVTNNY